MTIFLHEIIATFLLILLGDGVVANVLLNKSGMKGAGSIQITFAWGLAVMLPAFIFGGTSGAHMNPAVSIALAISKDIGWDTVPAYIAGQFIGAMAGAFLVYALFKRQFDATEDGATKRGCFCTAPAVPDTGLNLLSEVVGTFVLVFAIKGIGQVANLAPGVDKLLVFGIIVSIGMSLGGLTGYAINPARDLGPRIAYALIPMKDKVDPNWGYSWIPVVGPIIGGVLGVLLYGALFPTVG